MHRRWRIAGVSLLIFMVLCYCWLSKARQHPMENDELYSQTSSIAQRSYLDMLTGKIEEGNNTPLFYALQKMVEQISQYQTPQEWTKGQWGFRHQESNVILRIVPVVCMAAGVSLIFYYFAMHGHILLGIYALLVSLTSYMVFTYGAQARPYALWFTLTVIQIVLLLRVIAVKPKDQGRYMWGLVAVHVLLSLTVIFSIIQNTAVCLILWVWGHKRLRDHVLLGGIPTAIVMFYYTHSPKYHFWFAEGFDKLLGASLPLDRLGLILLALCVWALAQAPWFKKWFTAVPKAQVNILGAALIFGAIIYAGCIAVLYKFKMDAYPYMEGFQVSNRYFMVLAPAGIFLNTFAAHYLATCPKGVLKKTAWGLLILLLVYRVIRTPWFS